MYHMWIFDWETDFDAEAPDHGLEPGDSVFLVGRSPTGFLLTSIGEVLEEDDEDLGRRGDLQFDREIPGGTGVPIDAADIPEHTLTNGIAKASIAEELGDRLTSAWLANEWVTAAEAMYDVPRNAWLLVGDQASIDYLEAEGEDFFFPDLAHFWTSPKQVRPGDLLLFYFMSPDKEIRYVGRAASYPFFADDIEVLGGRAGPDQWWVYYARVLEVDPIPLAVVKAAFDGHLNLRGGPKFVPPRVVEKLLPYIDGEIQEIGLVALPTGLAELPRPDAVDFDSWREIAAGALTLESHVEDYIVEPLLRFACEGQADLGWGRQVLTPHAGVADFAVMRDGVHTSVIEVKLGTRFRESGPRAGSPDFRQIRRYMDDMALPGMLIDANRMFLFQPGEERPHLVLERAEMTAEALENVAAHLGARTS